MYYHPSTESQRRYEENIKNHKRLRDYRDKKNAQELLQRVWWLFIDKDSKYIREYDK